MTPRNRTAITLLLDAGLRASEACDLTWAAVETTAALLHVIGGKGGRDRTVPVSRDAMAAWCRDRHPIATGPLYNTFHPDHPISRHALYKVVHTAGTHIGLNLWPHLLRHTYACRCLECGLSVYDVMLLLGHSDLATTAIYLHVRPDELADRVRRALARPPAPRLALEA